MFGITNIYKMMMFNIKICTTPPPPLLFPPYFSTGFHGHIYKPEHDSLNIGTIKRSLFLLLHFYITFNTCILWLPKDIAPEVTNYKLVCFTSPLYYMYAFSRSVNSVHKTVLSAK